MYLITNYYVVCQGYVSSEAPIDEPIITWNGKSNILTFKGGDRFVQAAFLVDGVGSAQCADAIERIILAVAGVKSVLVTWSTAVCLVEYNAELVTADELASTISDGGFGSVISVDPAKGFLLWALNCGQYFDHF